MRKFGMKRAIVGAAIAALALNAPAAHAASATGTATAKILRQITLTNTSALQYATIISGATASTVAVTTAGARSPSKESTNIASWARQSSDTGLFYS